MTSLSAYEITEQLKEADRENDGEVSFSDTDSFGDPEFMLHETALNTTSSSEDMFVESDTERGEPSKPARPGPDDSQDNMDGIDSDSSLAGPTGNKYIDR